MLKTIHQYRILIGLVLWLVWMLAVLPRPLDVGWGRGILLLAPFVIVPLATDLLTRTFPFSSSKLLPKIIRWQLPSAILFALAFLLPNGSLSMLCVLPWVGVTFSIAWIGGLQIWQGAWRNPAAFSISAGMVYLSVAGVWAVMERAGIIPFGFNPEIIFLTIVHFHYAGFVLPVLAGLATGQLGSSVFNQITCYMTVAAVGLLAVGITLTQLGFGHDFELVSAWIMALSAAAVAAMHLQLASQKGNSLKPTLLWATAGMALFGGMLLAGLYGTRFIAPIAWLDIPMMRALHGTLNAVGFSLCAISGWWVFSKK
ncbi:MAG: YndJ family transporter [Saprospiraceae bacterium]|nr:YndJ family transporter [Saprospiraceae bacterium]